MLDGVREEEDEEGSGEGEEGEEEEGMSLLIVAFMILALGHTGFCYNVDSF